MEVLLVRVLILAVMFLSQFGAHFFPWWIVPGFTDKARLLHRVLAYIYGCVWILLGMVLYGLVNPEAWPVIGFLAEVMVVAGIGALASRGVRMVGENQVLRRDVQSWERAATGGQAERG